MISRLTSGRTPSCTAISSASPACLSPLETDSNRFAPPVQTICGTAKPCRRHSLSQYSIWLDGRTTTIRLCGSASANRCTVCISTGRPSSGRNCLGSRAPMRAPLPPATMMTAMLSVAFFIDVCSGDAFQRFVQRSVSEAGRPRYQFAAVARAAGGVLDYRWR